MADITSYRRQRSRRSPALFPILILGLCTLASGCTTIGGAPINKVVELVSEGGTKLLRENPRPIRGTARVIVLALDGVGYDDLERAIATGRMPRTAELLGPRRGPAGVYQHAYSAPDVLSVLPSITIAAWASIFTGLPPAETGVTGNEWWAREEGEFYAPAPGSFTSNAHAIRMYTDGLLGRVTRGPTLFEQVDLRSHVSMLQLHRGADLLQLAELGQFGDLFEQVVKDAVKGGPRDPDTFRETDQTSVASVISDLNKHGVPDLQVVYLGGVDAITHFAPEPIESQQRYLADVLDPLIGKVLGAYREKGTLADTYVIFVADHGHTPVLGDDRHALGTEGDDEPPAVLERAGFRVRPFELKTEKNDFQAVMAYQGPMAYIYLANRATCLRPGETCNWMRPARLEQDVLPAARAFYEANRTGAGVPALHGTLDLVFAREPVAPGQPARPFKIFDGKRLVPVAEYLARSPRPDLIRLDERLRQLAEGPLGHRAGDVLLLAKTGTNRPLEERFYFGSEGFTSWHGGAAAQDSRVPFIVAHPGTDGQVLRARVRSILGRNPSHMALAPLVRDLLRTP